MSCAWPKSWPIRRHTARGLPPCPFQAVLQFAVLEVLEVERGRMLHQPQAGFVAETFGQQAVDQRHGATQDVGQDGESQFQREQPADAVEQPAAPAIRARSPARPWRLRQHTTSSMISLPTYSVTTGNSARASAQQRLARGKCGTGLPDERKERRQVAQGTHALAPRPRLWCSSGTIGSGAPAHCVMFGHRDAVSDLLRAVTT